MVLASVELSGANPVTILNLTRGYVIEQIVFCDDGGTAQNMTLWIHPAGVARADRYLWISDRRLLANSTFLLLEHNMTLAYDETISAEVSVGNVSVNVVGY